MTVLPDGSVAVCDTYNGAVRRYDPGTGELTTLAADLAEPSGAYVDSGHLVVVESGAHRLTRVALGAAATRTDGFAHTTQRPVTDVAATLELVVAFDPPPGQKVDDRFGPPSQLVVEATPPALIREGGGRGTDLARTLVLDPAVGDGVLHVAARAASCDVDGGEGAACRMHQQDWGVPVRVSDTGDGVLLLPLAAWRAALVPGVTPAPMRAERPGAPRLGGQPAATRSDRGGPLFFEARCGARSPRARPVIG